MNMNFYVRVASIKANGQDIVLTTRTDRIHLSSLAGIKRGQFRDLIKVKVNQPYFTSITRDSNKCVINLRSTLRPFYPPLSQS